MSGQISPVVVAALDRVVSDNGWLSASRAVPLRAALSDVLGSETDQHRAELDALVVSAEEGIPSRLRTAGRAAAQGLAPELSQRLVAWGMAEDLATDVVATWASLVPEISSSTPAVEAHPTVVSAPKADPVPVAAEPTTGPVAETTLPPGSAEPTRAGTGGRTYVWMAGAAAVALVITAGGWIGFHRGGDHPESPLLASLARANANAHSSAKGLIPPKTCTATDEKVSCIDPNPDVTRLVVRTFDDKQALYDAYVASAEKLRGAPLEENEGDCNSRMTSGELSWNHQYQHPTSYSVQDHISSDLTKRDMAEGRLACEVSGNFETIVWTADSGNMLGELDGPAMADGQGRLFAAWRRIHHAIIAPGSGPMNDMTDATASSSTGM